MTYLYAEEANKITVCTPLTQSCWMLHAWTSIHSSRKRHSKKESSKK